MRYFLRLSYDGTLYHGWQVQPNGDSVQACLQRALSALLRQDVSVTGAGRTDAGVHASLMVAHFDAPADLDCPQLVYRLNKMLPPDIAIQDARPVAEGMHARFSATSRTYHYFVHLSKSPFRRQYSWQLYGDIDFQRMNAAAQCLLGEHDFTSFSKTGTDTKTNICNVTEARWEELEPGVWRFTISANRFLRNMVRAVVGTLIEVGRGRLDEEQLRLIIRCKDRCEAGQSVPAHGLFLVDIRYPDSI